MIDKGWECPKCGAVMSPTTDCCVNCRGVTEITLNTQIDVNAFGHFIEKHRLESEDAE